MPRADAAAVAVVDGAEVEGVLKHCLEIHISEDISDFERHKPYLFATRIPRED